MLGLWSAAFYHHIDGLDYDTNTSSCPDASKAGEDDLRGHKRQRRSIFFAGPDSESDDDGDDVGNGRSIGHLKAENLHLKLTMIPATPYTANSLCRGACTLTPSFSRRSSSPCLDMSSAFMAVHEEANSGFRSYMEDRSAAMTADGVAYLGIYDGHGGVDASTFLQRHLLPTIQAHLRPGCDIHEALTAAYKATNAAFQATGSIQGSTATTIILQKGRLIAANVGDSPAFVVKKSGEVYSVIREHKIEGEEEARIEAYGAPIYRSPTGPAYMGTPDGTRWLNMSRAFGDFVYPAISCEPHVCALDVTDGRYLVMGSDGLTEKWPVAEAAQYVTQLAANGWDLAAICKSMVEKSLARGSTDNISCMIVDLEAYMMHVETSKSGGQPAAVSLAQDVKDVAAAVADVSGAGGPGECLDMEVEESAPVSFGPIEESGSEGSPIRPVQGDDEHRRQHHQQLQRRCSSPGDCEVLGKRRRGPLKQQGDTDASARIGVKDVTGLAQLLCEETPAEDEPIALVALGCRRLPLCIQLGRAGVTSTAHMHGCLHGTEEGPACNSSCSSVVSSSGSGLSDVQPPPAAARSTNDAVASDVTGVLNVEAAVPSLEPKGAQEGEGTVTAEVAAGAAAS